MDLKKVSSEYHLQAVLVAAVLLLLLLMTTATMRSSKAASQPFKDGMCRAADYQK